jgi:hypothetical protein
VESVEAIAYVCGYCGKEVGPDRGFGNLWDGAAATGALGISTLFLMQEAVFPRAWGGGNSGAGYGEIGVPPVIAVYLDGDDDSKVEVTFTMTDEMISGRIVLLHISRFTTHLLSPGEKRVQAAIE